MEALVGDVDRFLIGAPLAARGDSIWYWRHDFQPAPRTRIAVVVALLAAVAAAWSAGRRTGGEPAAAVVAPPLRQTVAVLPFRNVGSDASLDFLRQALPDEIATILSHIRSVSVRPVRDRQSVRSTRRSISQQAGREMRATTVVTGHFLRNGEMMRICARGDRRRDQSGACGGTPWMSRRGISSRRRRRSALRVRGGLATTLGWPASDGTAAPTNEEAYGLFLRSTALTLDPVSNGPAIEMLERSVALDPTYAPAWVALARRYYVESRYRHRRDTLARYEAAMERALSLDPDYIAAASGLILGRTERGDLTAAYKQATDLVRRRPDSIDAHFVLSYVLRYAGKLDEAAQHCETAFLLDPADPDVWPAVVCVRVHPARRVCAGDELRRSRSRIGLRESVVDPQPDSAGQGGRGGRARLAEHAGVEQLRSSARRARTIARLVTFRPWRQQSSDQRIRRPPIIRPRIWPTVGSRNARSSCSRTRSAASIAAIPPLTLTRTSTVFAPVRTSSRRAPRPWPAIRSFSLIEAPASRLPDALFKTLVRPGRQSREREGAMEVSWMRRCEALTILLASAMIAGCQASSADTRVFKLAELNTDQIRALDREKTVVLLPGGILEEHGPYLPSYTDGYLNERLTEDLAKAIAQRPGWSVVVFPVIPLGLVAPTPSAGGSRFQGRMPYVLRRCERFSWTWRRSSANRAFAGCS